MKKIMIINTNTDHYKGLEEKTGLWLGELVHFYDYFKDKEVQIDLFSVNGGKVPIDPFSVSTLMLDYKTKNYMEDPEFMKLLDNTKSIHEAEVSDYDAVYFTGGHGTVFDFVDNKDIARILNEMNKNGKVISSVCHGAAAFLNFDNNTLKDIDLTGFSNLEEQMVRKTKKIPFLLEDELKKKGANYKKAALPMVSKVVQDGNIITGQNPQSPKGVAKKVWNTIQ
ncbi:type 1 glutamine amidotransferase domain-containing protein [Macrococcoides caseolyticum]|uniref:type 1 glutamine amidotransferase domain-containing protein n=1 Tax=Macrococcoides caseolyticum TaxID=69966 RepID=UPI001F2F1240|nr:type 1 glutamine amidotransferase domain-containing protein [Macrococcus caseolyticus]MCE4957117.1 type 1 glutamine amidotransferase domain-containing protein [Macrococcus caseolyticus]